MRVARLERRGLRGVTLLEVAIVVAIIGILAGMAGTLLTGLMPSWRTRRAAREFSVAVNTCRQMAIAQGVEYRIRLAEADSDLDTIGDNAGRYFLERGNASVNSTAWDVLPVDMDGSDSQTAEGTVDIGKGGEDALPGVSIEQWDPISGRDGDDIVCSPRGWLLNPAGDFDANGYLSVNFVNKYARGGVDDEWRVLVSRGGMVRLESSRMATVGAASGTPEASQWTSSGATGHSP